MRKIFFALVLLAVLSTAVYGQNETGGTTPPPDPCAGVTCNSPPAAACEGSSVKTYSSPGTCSGGQCSYSSSLTNCPNGCENGQCKANFCDTASCGTASKTCPDGFSATCTKTCDRTTQSCSSCEPSCQGHETQSGGGGSGSGAASNTTSGGGGSTGPLCEAVQTLGVDASGRCSAFSNSCLPHGWTKVEQCPESQSKCGNNICEPGEADVPGGCGPDADPRCLGPPAQAGTCPQDCAQGTQSCPANCECKYDDKGNIVSTSCESRPMCNYNGVCDKGEDSSCKDCIGGECPVSKECEDGTKVNCYRSESGCQCGQCPLPAENIPQGCRQEMSNGFVRVVCDQQQIKCPTTPQEVKLKCVDSGGTPRFGRDAGGCDTFQCDFGGQRTNSPVFATAAQCPSPEDVSRALEKCKEFNLEGVITFEGGCKIGKCIQAARQCPNPTESEKMSMEEKCRAQGQQLVFEFDGQCNQPKCGQRHGEGCQRDLPKEAYDKCAEGGGQLVVRRDQNGCVSYSNCLRRGDTEESFVEEIEEIPDVTELLSIAFKLEDLKLEFDKLAKKTDDIADYYKSTGSSEEKRFRRVSDMFSSAKDKVDEVKTKLRDRARDITKDDVLEIKQDLRYLKDVILKDILFVMLGSGDEIEDIKSGTAKECGTDGSCFDRAIRVCQPVTFRPEGRNGPIVELKGLEGDACILYAKLPEGQGPPGGPYDMTCKIQKYSLGVRNPDTDIFPYCTGSMVELIKKYGTGPPGVPGKCSGDECRDYCGRGPAEAKECLQYLGDMLPPEAKEGLEAIASGRAPSERGGFGFGEGEFEGGEFREEFEQGEFQSSGGFGGGGGGQLCPDGICDDFEQKNPNACPQDCGSSGSSGGGGGVGSGVGGIGIQPQQPQSIAQPQPVSSRQSAQQPTTSRQACSGCLNNGVCDPGECSECADCLRG